MDYLHEALSNKFSLKRLLVMIYEQFMVSIVELIMLSWQQLLSHNFQNTRVTWLSCRFFRLQVSHILHDL